MGLVGLNTILQNMRAHGCEDERPAALIEHATLPEQRILVGTLGTIEGIVAAARPTAHTLIIVGDVVRLQQDLYWFGNTPANKT